MSLRPTSILPTCIVLLWLLLVAAGMRSLTEYANRPGDAGEPCPTWPTLSRVSHGTNTPTLVMFAHPRCPCTRASIGELAVLMAQCEGRLDARVVFFRPDEAGPDWTQTDLWTAAARIPGVEVFDDQGGSETRRFGAATSGLVLVYDSNDALMFQGGITGARGHSGDNLGRTSILRLLESARPPGPKSSAYTVTPVFGCPLFEAPTP